MQFDFAVYDSADAFHDTVWFVIGLARAFDIGERRSWQHTEGTLKDDLVPGIEFRDDEMHGGPEAQHMVLKCVFIRSKTRKRRQQTVMQIDDPSTRKFPAEFRRKHLPLSIRMPLRKLS